MSRTKWRTSNTPIYGIVVGTSTISPPDLDAQNQSTVSLVMTGLSTGDVVLSVDHRGTLSTAYAIGGVAAGSSVAKITFVNCHASTVSHSTSVTFRWAYLDRT